MSFWDLFKDKDEAEEVGGYKPYGESIPLAKGAKTDASIGPPSSEATKPGSVTESDIPDTKEYLAKKYNLAEQFKSLSSDNTDVTKAREQAERQQKLAGVLQGVSQMFAGSANTNGAVYDGMRTRADNITKNAESDRKHRLNEFMTADQLREKDDERTAKSAEQTELNDPASKKSRLYSDMGRSRVKQLIAEANTAGDADGAAQLVLLDKELGEGKYSAAQLADMKVLDKVDYKDIINNKAAMARQNAADARADKRHDDSLKAEDRRLTQQEFNMVRTLRDDVTKDPMMREAAAGRVALAKGIAAAAAGNPAGDEALIVAWQKNQDPISVVREGEFARTTAGQGLIRRYESAVSKAVGNGIITPEIRAELVATMKDLEAAYQPYAASKLKVMDANIKRFNLDPDLVYGDFHKGIAGREAAAPAEPGKAPPPATYPRTVRHSDGRTTEVENAEEAKEAAAEGFN